MRLLWWFFMRLIKDSLSLLRVWKLWFHILKISHLVIFFNHSSTRFIPALFFKFTDKPFTLDHSLLFSKEKKFFTEAYWGEYYGTKNITWKFSLMNSVADIAVWKLALSNKIIVLLFLILHFARINFIRSDKNSINLDELIESDNK